MLALSQKIRFHHRELDAMKAANSSQYAKVKALEEEIEKGKKGLYAKSFVGW